jgi:nucleoside-diphosphate-sugar epimerase
MMMMEDAIRATISIMEAPSSAIRERGGYNIAGCSFTPSELSSIIQRSIPSFTISYTPDFRQAIADSWPASIDDSAAHNDWGWQREFDTEKLCATMLSEIGKKKVAKLETHA